jgi:tetraacyldisaccharide 4'-kinase
MNVFYPWAERVRRGKPVPLPLAALLTAATPIQRVGMWWRLRGDRVRVRARVISFGNITAGGAGKTPAVIERARREIAAGHTVGILTRGYRRLRRHKSVVIVSGAEAATKWELLGDEPALIGRKAPETIIACGVDRIEGAHALIERHGCDTLILDDGFQYVRLERDENVVLIDTFNPFGNGRLVPRGILREPLAALARATHVVFTRCDQARDLPRTIESVRQHCPHARVRLTRHAPTTLWRADDGQEVLLDSLRGERVIAACAIASPESFIATLRSLGAKVLEERAFRDHATIPVEALRSDLRVVITENDAARLHDAPPNVFVLGIELQDILENTGNAGPRPARLP